MYGSWYNYVITAWYITMKFPRKSCTLTRTLPSPPLMLLPRLLTFDYSY